MTRVRASNAILTSLVAMMLGLGTCAATPGHIGGCNSQAGVADPVEFCRQKETRICARTNALNPDPAMYSTCISQIDTTCAGRNWPVGCAPSEQTTNACLDALVEPGRISIPASMIPECNALCGGSGGGIDPEGI